ncbi:MAG: MarR family transcriptional regulator [Spirochaetales bacterium]|nr:MarR family transcriptional regulator [Spirochaetales bacterium]
MINSTSSIAQNLMDALHALKKAGWQQHNMPVEEGLSPVEFLVLRSVTCRSTADTEQTSKGITPSDISHRLHITSPTVTQHITNLEKKGYIIREVDKQDRRVVRINLTEKGLLVRDLAKSKFLKIFEGLIQYLGEKESSDLVMLLRKSTDYLVNLQKMDEQDNAKYTEKHQEN